MKVTVVIPTTAGRTKYLAATIATCTAQPGDNLEILVSDNSGGDAEALVRSIADPRLRYIRPPQFLTMSAHWEFVLGNLTGDCVTFIGDDDGLMPGCMTDLAAIHAEHGNVPIHHALSNYWWPDHPNVAWRNRVALMHDPKRLGRWQDSNEFLTLIARGERRYYDGPSILQNFIPLPLIEKIRAKGPFFRRAIPDVYSSLALAAASDRFFMSDRFLTIGGQGAKSNGARVGFGSSDGSTFSAETAANPLFVPRSPTRTVSGLLVDSLLEVAEQFDRPDLAAQIDYARHFEDALFEALHMPDPATRRFEVRETLRLAARHGALTRLGALAAARAGAKLARMAGLAGPRQHSFLGSNAPHLMFDDQVTDIVSAAAALADHLDAAAA